MPFAMARGSRSASVGGPAIVLAAEKFGIKDKVGRTRFGMFCYGCDV